MLRRGSYACIFGTLAFIATIHVFEAFVALFFGKDIVLLRLYPIISSLNINSLNYLIGSLTLTSILIAITFKLAFTSPLEDYINMIITNAKMADEAECEMITENRSTLDMICETVSYLSEVLGQTKDITYNVRSELVPLRPIPNETKKISVEIADVKKEIIRLKKNFQKTKNCPSCGNIASETFKICPYCGEALRLKPENIIVKNLK